MCEQRRSGDVIGEKGVTAGQEGGGWICSDRSDKEAGNSQCFLVVSIHFWFWSLIGFVDNKKNLFQLLVYLKCIFRNKLELIGDIF